MMLLREALKLSSQGKPNASKSISLLCSFEPLHLKTYIEAALAQRFPEERPALVTFGFDQLRDGLASTSAEFQAAPVLLCLSWEDIHPALSWRSRAGFESLTPAEVSRQGEALEAELRGWLSKRPGAETYVALPPADWLPYCDPCSPQALGPLALAAGLAMARISLQLASGGARVLRIAPSPLNFRDLLQAGFPLTLDAAEGLATRFVELAFKTAPRKKALVVDLDDTLWSGVIGEDGPEGIHCDPQGKGAGHHVFQKFLRKLKDEGVLLAFCSKNNPQDVLPHFASLDMPLKPSDFAASRCNWERKSDNILSIAQELNIGADSLVVVDDNEAELAEIRHHIPEAVCLKTPHEGRSWQALFERLQELFGSWRLSAEDRQRTGFFAGRAPAAARRPPSADDAGYLKDLELEVTIDPDAFKSPRSLDLINKTNQFNLTGERVSNEDWLKLSAAPGAFCLSASLKDRFGGFGAVCVAAGTVEESAIVLRHFVLSCRAFGRRVETVVLGELATLAPREWIEGPYHKTDKNEPARRFLEGLGCDGLAAGRWRLKREAAQAASARTIGSTGVSICRPK